MTLAKTSESIVTGQKSYRLKPQDFAAAFGEVPSPYLADRIENYNFEYRPLGSNERDFYLRQIVDTLCNMDLVRAGDARLGQWESGWGAHLSRIEEKFDVSALVPGYFGKYPVVRWQQDFIQPLDRKFEYNSYAVIQDWLFDKYFRKAAAVYEFGCGTGHNLFRVRKVNPSAALWGLDWTEASQQILGRLNQLGVDRNLYGQRFNLFEPNADFRLAPYAAIYTSAALEQIGDRFKPFIGYLLKNRPKLCVHIEPIAELLDETCLIDYLSVTYFKRRNYLTGFLSYLRALERDGQIKIHMASRNMIGSFYIEGYSVVVWSPTA